MSLDGNTPDLIYFAGRQKYFSPKGMKLYAAIVKLRKNTRILRQSARTATVAEQYGQLVVERYKRLCAVAEKVKEAAARKVKKNVQPGRRQKVHQAGAGNAHRSKGVLPRSQSHQPKQSKGRRKAGGRLAQPSGGDRKQARSTH
jgi:hypothetical protein